MQEFAFRRHILGFGVAAAFCGVMGNPSSAVAQDTWLMPSTYRAGVSDTVSASCWTGEGLRGTPLGWRRAAVNTFELVGFRTVSLAGLCADGDTTWARFTPVDEEGEILRLEGNWATELLAPPEFEGRLNDTGQAAVLNVFNAMAPTGHPVREAVRWCAKAWIPGSAGERGLKSVGAPIELTPLGDPGGDGPARFRLELGGKPVAGGLVRAWRRPLGADGRTLPPDAGAPLAPLASARTNAAGEATLPLKGRGEFLVGAAVTEQADPATGADWRTNRATFTFARP